MAKHAKTKLATLTASSHRCMVHSMQAESISTSSGSGDSKSLVKDKFTFLEELTSAKPHHGKKTFYQHLVNVYAYLKSQSRSEEVCDAGLFHAIYGTERFEFQSDAVTREVVRGYIGKYAEELVHIYCDLKDRFQSIVNNTAGWTSTQHLDLCWLEYANAYDHREFGQKAYHVMETLSQVISRLEDTSHMDKTL